ncbi:hypothetical protein, partial [Escherichia coli]|uniref:hypothetical protein n=1 Tax=Escherichia coli TaxID=562 RepID=UPI001D5B0283|nr:hypothetical protein [Escherichia coli]
MTKVSIAAFMAVAALTLTPGAASAQAIEVGPGGVAVHGDHHGEDAHHGSTVEHRVIEEHNSDGVHETTHEGGHGGGHEESG